MNYDLRLVGDKIKQQRKGLGLTQDKLAERIGLSTTYLCQIENGSRGVNLTNIISIANCLSVTLDYLVSDFTGDTIKSTNDLDSQWMQLFADKSPSSKQMLINLVTDMLKHITT